MKYMYEAIIEEVGERFEARFPDLDIITQGDDLQDAIFMAQDLLENHIVVALQQGETLPRPTFGNVGCDAVYRAAIVVDCDARTPEDDSMTVQEASDMLGVSSARVRAMIRDGILRSKKVGMVHMVDAESVRQRFNSPRKAGRPKRVATEG